MTKYHYGGFNSGFNSGFAIGKTLCFTSTIPILEYNDVSMVKMIATVNGSYFVDILDILWMLMVVKKQL